MTYPLVLLLGTLYGFMLVYRPDLVSYAWWHGAGGFKITYPNYAWYKDSINHFTSKWIKDTFGEEREAPHKFHDMLVTIIK